MTRLKHYYVQEREGGRVLFTSGPFYRAEAISEYDRYIREHRDMERHIGERTYHIVRDYNI